MTFKNFENKIDPVILSRGYDYFTDGAVEDLTEKPAGQWNAVVAGSDDYEVTVLTNGIKIIEWSCDCPYEHGPVCKHVTAVLYAISESSTEITEAVVVESTPAQIPVNKPKNIKPNKKTKADDPVNAVIDKMTGNELKSFLLEQIKTIPELKNAFLATFAGKVDAGSTAKYVNIINSIADTVADRHSFIDYRSASKLTIQLMVLCNKAAQFLAQKNLSESLAITRAIIEEIPEILTGMDDSDGGGSMIWETAFENFQNIIKQSPPLLKDELFEFCLAQYPMKKYHNCDFDSYFIDVLPLLVNSAEHEIKFFNLIDKQVALEQTRQYGEYTLTNLLKAKIRYLQNNDRYEDASLIINQNIEIYEFREILIETAIKHKNFQEAKNHCFAGIETAKRKQHPGKTSHYMKLLLEVAEKEKDVPRILELSENLFFDNYFSMDYYRKLKKYWEHENWPEKCELVIDKIKGPEMKGNYNNAEAMAAIFIEEKYYDRLLHLLQTNNTRLKFVDSFAHHISSRFPAEILKLYETALEKHAEFTGRGVYQEVARYLKKMAKISGGQLIVAKLVARFREKYKNRSAMLEILNKHFS
jgi:uncharacterized Zn finger protein